MSILCNQKTKMQLLLALILVARCGANISMGNCHIPVVCSESNPSPDDQQERGSSQVQGLQGKQGPAGPQGMRGPPGPEGNCTCPGLVIVTRELDNLKGMISNIYKTLAVDCSSLLMLNPGDETNVIFPYKDKSKEVLVMCDVSTVAGGWTVIQHRFDGSQNFYLGWEAYVDGFGSPRSEHWLGLETLHHLTKRNDQMLRVQLEDREGNIGHATYSTFVVGPKETMYRLTVAGYQGNIGNSLLYHNGIKFSTKDRENDNDKLRHCARSFSGGWWYHSCRNSNLNGDYSMENSPNSVNWYTWKANKAMKSTKLMIRPKDI